MIARISREVWKPIPGYPNYDVSTKGRIRAWKPRWGRNQPRLKEPRFLKPWLRGGYAHVTLERQHYTVHELLLMTFRGPRPPGQVSRHLDDIKANCTLDNLVWGTRKQNREDASRNGIQGKGSPWAKKLSAKFKGKPQSLATRFKVREGVAKKWKERKAQEGDPSWKTRQEICPARRKDWVNGLRRRTRKANAHKAAISSGIISPGGQSYGRKE
jgi:hypothetical protein